MGSFAAAGRPVRCTLKPPAAQPTQRGTAGRGRAIARSLRPRPTAAYHPPAVTLRTYSIQTLGCKVNQYEAEQLATLLRARGLVPAATGAGADVRVVHTCSVTVQAAGKSRQAVRRAATAGGVAGLALPVLPSGAASAERLAAGPSPGGRVVVTGCWATSDPAAARAVPGVDAVLTHHGDVAADLDALLANWQAAAGADNDRATTEGPQCLHRQGDQKPFQDDIGDTSAGTPAGDVAALSKLPRTAGVNVKIALPATPQAFVGSAAFDASVRDQAAADSAPFAGTSTLPLLHDHQTGRQRALLKVQDGCDAHCTYCIIPRLRPGVRSKPVDDAVAEAARLVAGGHVELVLTGIFLGAYGHATALRRRQTPADVRMKGNPTATPEPASASAAVTNGNSPAPDSSFFLRPSSLPRQTPLASLVDALCTRVTGLRRLRLSSLEPGDLTADLLAVLRSHPQVVPHFHLPLQSGSATILRRMNRQYGPDDFRRMVDRVRAAFDRPAMTTDVIVGFPGETDAEFARTAEAVEHAGFIGVHAFGFSPRPGTAAARWQKDFVRGPVVTDRIAALRAAADRHSLAFRRSFVGQTVELLVERERDHEREHEPNKVDGQTVTAGNGDRDRSGSRHGRCERYFPVWFDDPAAGPGDFARVRVEVVTPTRTHGVRVG
jgi:tRNA A37 methylthiotransferase MiaB